MFFSIFIFIVNRKKNDVKIIYVFLCVFLSKFERYYVLELFPLKHFERKHTT